MIAKAQEERDRIQRQLNRENEERDRAYKRRGKELEDTSLGLIEILQDTIAGKRNTSPGLSKAVDRTRPLFFRARVVISLLRL